MKRCAWIFLGLAPLAFAAEAGDALARARAARADGVPQAAIADLKAAISGASGRAAVDLVVELARCLIEADRGRDAVTWTLRTVHRDEPAVVFWRAQARAEVGDFAAALNDYERAANDANLRSAALLGRAQMLDALGRSEEALEAYDRVPPGDHRVAAQLAAAAILIRNGRDDAARSRLEALEPATDRDRERHRYLKGRLALEGRYGDEATRLFQKLNPTDVRLAAGRVIGEAEAIASAGDVGRAQERVESFVREHPRHPLLGDLLTKLDDLRSRETDPSSATLKRWENDEGNPELAALASFYLARSDERLGRTGRAIRNYEDFIEAHPDHPLRVSAAIRLAVLRLKAGDIAAAAQVVEATPAPADRAAAARLGFVRGATEYGRAQFAAAARSFVSAANLDPSLTEAALANAAVAAVAAGDEPQASEILNALRKENAATARRIELAQALERARLGAPDAGEQLQWIAERGGAAGQRARLAVAEWHWQQGDAAGARREFRRVANSKAAGRDDQADYFAVFLADDGSEKTVEAVSTAARDFLARFPDSPREAQVRLKWGEALLRAGDHRGARVQFEEAGNSTSDPALRQSAFFLAARAAAGSMRPEELDAAIPLLEQVATAKASPELAGQARWEQAKLQGALGRPDESVKILDRLIAETKDRRLELAARLKRGDALLTLAEKDPSRRAEALAEWRRVAAAKDALPAERNEALVHAATANRVAGDTDAAVAAYYEVLTAPRDDQPEYFWYYKAGFDAANLLATEGRLKEAAAIYEKMAAAPGPRAEEARESVKRLRLENFIWEN